MNHDLLMKRCVSLGLKALGNTYPNPNVGALLFYDGKIISEGFTKEHGKNHAEINVMNKISDNEVLKKSTLYVTLEPCSHYGKTPPCVNELIKLKPKEIVISNKDPNPKVNGKGIKKIKEMGIKVVTNILKEKGEKLNKRFFNSIKNKRPYIILKWAETKNNLIANRKNNSKWISNNLSRQFVHKWRSVEDSILVGASTVEFDNPNLTVRKWAGRNPIRLVINPKKRLDNKKNIFNKLSKTLNIDDINEKSLKKVIGSLIEKNILSIIVEGGSFTLNKFIKNNLWDEIRIFKSKKNFRGGLAAPKFNYKKKGYKKIFDDQLFILFNK